MNTFDLTLDLDKSAGVTQWVAIRQGDKSGTTIRATIYDHGTALSGNYTARICMRLPDGTHFYEKDATLSGNVATVTIDETQAASVSGLTHNAYFQIIQGSAVVASTQDFTVKVLRDAMSDAEVGENYSTQIEQAVESLENMTSTIPTKVKDEVDAQLEAHPEWTTTVEDNSLTDAKLIQHGGILDRVARLMYRLDNLLTATPAEADSLTVTDAAKTPLAGLALYGRSTQSGTPTPSAPVDIVSVEPDEDGNVSLWARGKNLLTLATTIYNSNRCTYTVTETGITLVGNATSSYCYVQARIPAVGGAQHTLHFDVQAELGYYVQVSCTGATLVARSAVSNATFTVPEGIDSIVVNLYVVSDTSGTHTAAFTNIQLELGSTATEYVPYAESTTPIDLQGHTLRSLPNGTRDEVTVDQYGHATLIQRVGVTTVDGTYSNMSFQSAETMGGGCSRITLRQVLFPNMVGATLNGDNCLCTHATYGSTNASATPPEGRFTRPADSNGYLTLPASLTTGPEAQAWLAENPVTFYAPLDEPVTIDLGTIDPIALQGPDMTAQSVPTAPFALTYERDLNVTLARLEASVAELATN